MRVAAWVFAVIVTMSSPVHAQGLFEMLFGAGQATIRPSQTVVRYAARQEGRVRRSLSPETRIPTLDELSGNQVRRYVEPAKPGPYIPPPVQPGPLGHVLRDPTLRKGDIVATEKGLMVYSGPGGSRHSERDFVAVGAARKLVGSKLPILLAMDRELRRGPTERTFASRVAPVVASNGEQRRQ